MSIQHHVRVSILSFQDKKQNHQAHCRTIIYQSGPMTRLLCLLWACLSTVMLNLSYPFLTIPPSCSLTFSHLSVHHYLHLHFDWFPVTPHSSWVIFLHSLFLKKKITIMMHYALSYNITANGRFKKQGWLVFSRTNMVSLMLTVTSDMNIMWPRHSCLLYYLYKCQQAD